MAKGNDFTGREIVLIGAASVLGLVALLFGGCGLTSVPAGHVGVVSNFGQVDEAVLGEGRHWVLPWKGVYDMSLQTKEDKEDALVPTKEGLTVKLEASLLYSVSRDRASEIYRGVGKDYEAVLVRSQFKSASRGHDPLRGEGSVHRRASAHRGCDHEGGQGRPRRAGHRLREDPAPGRDHARRGQEPDRGQAGRGPGRPADDVRAAEGEAGGRAEDH